MQPSFQLLDTSVGRWQRTIEADGRCALRKAPPTGRPERLTEVEEKRLIVALTARAMGQHPGAHRTPRLIADFRDKSGTESSITFADSLAPQLERPAEDPSVSAALVPRYRSKCGVLPEYHRRRLRPN